MAKTNRIDNKMKKNEIIFNVLIKKQDELFLAHCLELDILTAADDLTQVKDDIIDLMIAQIEYAFNNDNLEYLYKPAPIEVWQEFYGCDEAEIIERKISPSGKNKSFSQIPHYILTKNCFPAESLCHA